MKRISALFLAVLILFSSCLPVFAFESQDKLTPAPEITSFSENGDTGSYTAEFSHSLSRAEELRKMVYDLALEKYGSAEALMNSPEKYLAYETKLYLELSDNGFNWKTVTQLSENKFDISVKNDLLPFIDETKSDNDIVFLRILLASENFTDETAEKIYIYTPSKTTALYINDENSLIPDGVTLHLKNELQEDMTLFIPEVKGYIFDGWSADGDKRINTIPEGTTEICLNAHFIPMEYEINYVLTTDITYPFGRANNTKNPVFYTVGAGAKLYSIESPVTGYTFAGWYTSPDFSGEKITEIYPYETGDKLLYAKWVSDKELEQQKELERLEYITDNKFGDPDGDGQITAADARYVLRAAVGLEEPDYEKLKRVDYYNTNKIAAENARITLRIAVGLESLYEILLENGILP